MNVVIASRRTLCGSAKYESTMFFLKGQVHSKNNLLSIDNNNNNNFYLYSAFHKTFISKRLIEAEKSDKQSNKI